MRFKLPENYTVEYYHTPNNRLDVVHLDRGVTVMRRITRADVYDEVGEPAATGVAICNSTFDQFSKRIGRDIALGRALKTLYDSPINSSSLVQLSFDCQLDKAA